MLLRSSSTPMLNSWLPGSKEHSLEAEAMARTPSRSVCFSATAFHFRANGEDPSKESSHLVSETSFHSIPRPVKKQQVFQTLVLGGGDGNSGGGAGSGGGFGSNNHGSDSTDAYYQKMIEANPGNALLLANYARFLKDVRGDLDRAEEYCGRAILTNPNDGNVLCLYADLIWQNHKDASRAENYYDQAVKTSPDDCYVLASYARFLWDADEEDEEEGNNDHVETKQQDIERSHVSTPKFFQEVSLRPPLAAA